MKPNKLKLYNLNYVPSDDNTNLRQMSSTKLQRQGRTASMWEKNEKWPLRGQTERTKG